MKYPIVEAFGPACLMDHIQLQLGAASGRCHDRTQAPLESPILLSLPDAKSMSASHSSKKRYVLGKLLYQPPQMEGLKQTCQLRDAPKKS